MPISGELCTSHWGWPSVFIAHGAFCIIIFIIFGIIYRNNPGLYFSSKKFKLF